MTHVVNLNIYTTSILTLLAATSLIGVIWPEKVAALYKRRGGAKPQDVVVIRIRGAVGLLIVVAFFVLWALQGASS